MVGITPNGVVVTESYGFRTPNEIEISRLRGVLQCWGQVLLHEGRITINDYRGAVLGMGPVGEVRSNPLLEVIDDMREEARAAGEWSDYLLEGR